jgi:hypothetical protein
MTKTTAETIALVQLSNSVLLRAVSDALSYDLQIAPIVIASQPGIGTTTLLSGMARGMTDDMVEIRCAQISETDLERLPVLHEGEIQMREPSLSVVGRALKKETGSFLLLDDALANGENVLRAVLAQIARDAVGPVVVAIRVDLDQEEQALRIVQDELGLHSAHVPTARLAIDPSRPPIAQPVLLSGSMQLEGSKRGERYMEMYVSEPFDQTIRFTILAKPDQDDDDLNDAVFALSNDRDPVFARLEIVDGHLECTTDDITNS